MRPPFAAQMMNVDTSGAMRPLSLDLSNLNTDQVHSLLQQLAVQVNLQEQTSPISSANQPSITEQGVMAAQSSVQGTVSPLSTSLSYDNHLLTFQHQRLTSLYNILPLVVGS